MPEHRRKFSPRFKAEAVQRVISAGKPIAEVARDLGIHDGTLGNWVNAWRREHPEPDQPLSPVERARVKELEAEVAVARPALHDKAPEQADRRRPRGHPGPAQAMRVRVIEYEIPGRDGDGSGELIALITTITDPAAASAQELAQAYCQRWEEETGNDQLKTCLRGLGAALRSKSPAMVHQ